MISDGRVNLALAVSYFNKIFDKDPCCHTSFFPPSNISVRICYSYKKKIIFPVSSS